MKISVKQEHIERGEREEPYACPVALAMRESLGKKVYVDRLEFLINGSVVAKLPKSCARFIETFDRGLPVKPFSFRIKEPRE